MPHRSNPFKPACLLLFIALTSTGVSAQDTRLLWGDTHVHTSSSVDAYAYGNYTAGPDTAYRFARGLPVIHPETGQRIRIDRPLDFLVVADHAEMLQLQTRLDREDPQWLAKESAEELLRLNAEDPKSVFSVFTQIVNGGRLDVLEDFNQDALRTTAWAEQTDMADMHNEPGVFTALIGWEWSPGPDGINLHRVIFTPADADTAQQFIPLSFYDTIYPEEMWAWLDETRSETGADFVAIPHNSNLSGGKMFDMVDSFGRTLTSEYARARIRWEPVMEITQTKGTSETAPDFSPDDPFADHEIRNVLLSGVVPPMDEGSYARPALKRGLEIGMGTGINPYQFGFIGSTDSHTALVSVDESNHYGKLAQDSRPADRVNPSPGGFNPWRTSASGLAAVWATENTREAITEAFKRKEVYATTGPRIAVRFFGGFDFKPEDADASDLVSKGYSKGVTMGGDLTNAPDGEAPAFLIEVSKDPVGANLDRVQIIKGWMDAQGITHEQVFDVAWNDDRVPGYDGLLPPLPATVDINSASYENTVGSPRLSAFWTDPDFDPQQPAFYYVRALEIETPRLQVYDAVALEMDPSDTVWPVTIQERAFSSPIWYTP